MRVHHIGCGTLCPFGGRLIDGLTRGVGPADLVCHCLLVETGAGLVLVDTGLGVADADVSRRRLDPVHRRLMRVDLDPALTALARVRALGFAAEDVRHIVLTHLDFDHAGGITDFPRAIVHVFADELAAARRRSGLIGHVRYRPAQWGETGTWRTYAVAGESWMDFPAVRSLDGLPPEILLVPLAGHTAGHCGVAVETGEGWLLHAGDAYFNHREITPRAGPNPPGAIAYATVMETDRHLRLANRARLRDLVRRKPTGLRIFCAHDPAELERLAAVSSPVGAAGR
jgi:glyoxylase-like metal-dependent hydrolase (beta-lactamase superfamily II)